MKRVDGWEDNVEGIPAFEALSEVLPQVHRLDEGELNRCVKSHALRRLNPFRRYLPAAELFRDLSQQVGLVVELSGDAWSNDDVLRVIGCTARGSELDRSHLEIALRHVERVAAALHDLSLVADPGFAVGRAFREPPGSTDGKLRSMAEEPWTEIFADAHDYVARKVFEDGDLPTLSPTTRSLLRSIRHRAAS